VGARTLATGGGGGVEIHCFGHVSFQIMLKTNHKRSKGKKREKN